MTIGRMFFHHFMVVLLPLVGLFAAEPEKPALTAMPAEGKYLYDLGDSATILIQATQPGGKPGKGIMHYRLSFDGAGSIDEGVLELKDGRASVRGALDCPGFLRLDLEWLNGQDTSRATCGLGFAVEAIVPSGTLPADFERFWRAGRAELVRVPVDPQLVPLEVNEPSGIRCWQVSLAGVDGRVRGILTLPPGEGPFPAVLQVPGAGVGRSGKAASFAADGIAVLSINVHGIAPDSTDEFYASLRGKPLGLDWDYLWYGLDDPYQFYFHRVILDCFRALDYLCSRPEVDTARVAVSGSSQGGYLSIMTAALDSRVKAIHANVPGMCDHFGKLYGRPSGGPKYLQAAGANERHVHTLGYYDAALAARLVTAPAHFGVGFIDEVCPPTSVYAAFNSLAGPKQIENFYMIGHGAPQDYDSQRRKWLLETLNSTVKAEAAVK